MKDVEKKTEELKSVNKLESVNIETLYLKDEVVVYEVPIYQRNFAWGKDEIKTLIQDVYDACKEGKNYYIGTLVTFRKETGEYEVIDGQQRLTAVRLILSALGEKGLNVLRYKSREKSSRALEAIDKCVGQEKSVPVENLRERCNKILLSNEMDQGIIDGFRNAVDSLLEVVRTDDELNKFKEYFKKRVHIIRYQVPKDTDLNQYFEIMNSRGEQLEQHEIVKADLMSCLSTPEQKFFAGIWEACSSMDCYIQQSLRRQIGKELSDPIFGDKFDSFKESEKDFWKCVPENQDDAENKKNSIKELLDKNDRIESVNEEKETKEHFQPIIDFPNFLLIVLKITVLLKGWVPKKTEEEESEKTKNITLDDKNLKKHFKDYFSGDNEQNRVRIFAYSLLKAKFFLDNYIVHRSKEQREEDGKNPWQLQVWRKGERTNEEKNYGSPHNLCRDDQDTQDKLVQLLSMFEVTYGSRQRKNYLFYCLLFLMGFNSKSKIPASEYLKFLEELAERYLHEFYLKGKSEFSGNFDDVMVKDSRLNRELIEKNKNYNSEKFFNYDEMTPQEKPEESLAELRKIFGNGNIASSGISLFVFNYLDYKIWKLYKECKSDDFKNDFKETFGCNLGSDKDKDLNLNVFKNFFFSRSRDSLEHYFPTAKLETDPRDLSETSINCLGNYAMIGHSANSSGSDRTPEEKVDHYLRLSNKIDRVSVSSLKFRIMLKHCDDKRKQGKLWTWDEIKEHQEKMLNILFPKNDS